LTREGHPGRLEHGFSDLGVAERAGDPPTATDELIIVIIIIFINCSWVVTWWQWLFYMYTKYEPGY
jgi:hypothetical protein